MTGAEWNDWNWMKMLKNLYIILKSVRSQWKLWNKETDDDRGVKKSRGK